MLFLIALYIIVFVTELIAVIYLLIKNFKMDKQINKFIKYEEQKREEACEKFIERYLADSDQ